MVLDEYIAEAKEQGDKFNKKFYLNSTIRNYRNYLFQFKEMEILDNAKVILDDYNSFIDRSQRLIENSKEYG